MRKFSLKKVPFGLSVSLVLAMAIGSFALGETQTPANTQAETQSVAASNDGTGDFAVTGDASSYSFDSSSGVLTISGGDHTISMATGKTSTRQRIEVTGGATVTLDGVTIDDTTNGPAITISGSQDVTLLLADGSKNVLKGKAGGTFDNGAPGIQKTDSASGWLIIGVPDGSNGTGELQATGGHYAAGIGGGKDENGSKIEISGGKVTATTTTVYATGIGGGYKGNGNDIKISGGVVTAEGGSSGAGIGGGYQGSGSDIKISGGTVTATGGTGAAAIGSSAPGSGSNNKLNGNAVVIAQVGNLSKTVLEGFDGGLIKGIAFTRRGTSDDWSSAMYDNVTLSQNVEFPADLTVGKDTQQTLKVANGATLTLSRNSILTQGTYGSIDCLGGIKTVVGFKTDGGTQEDIAFTYMDANQIKTYGADLPSGNWTTAAGASVTSTTPVYLNEHTLYAGSVSRSDLKVDDGAVYSTDYLYDGYNNILKILTNKAMTIENKDASKPTGWRIVIASESGANLTLKNVNINTSTGAALKIPTDYASDVNITLADDSDNKLITTAQYCAGLQKGNVTTSNIGKLTIGAEANKGNGQLTAKGGFSAAGIGGGQRENGSNIEITGGVVTAKGEYGAAGIGGGDTGYGSGITISGGVVTATGGVSAAGIGGGGSKNGSDIKITCGTVTATGGIAGAGIGGGYYGSGSDIKISGGTVTATGGSGAAGIGGGRSGNGTGINITGGVVKAFGGYNESYDGTDKYPGAGIGGGSEVYGSGGEASDNHISGNAVVFAVTGGEYADGTKKEALQGFNSASQGSIANCITFTGVGIYEYNDDYIWVLTGVNWDESGKMYGDIVLTDDFTMPKNATLTIPQNNSLTINAGKTLTVPDGAVLTNDGTLTIKGTLSCTDTGKVETLLNYDKQLGMTKANDDNHVLYQDATEVKQYENMPSVEKEGYDLDGWYTKEKGQGTKVEEGDDILLNEHTLYANWIAEPEPTPTPPTPTPPEPGPEPTPDPSVDPDGDGSGASSKTSDPFMGGLALALLGVATTGAILTRKLR